MCFLNISHDPLQDDRNPLKRGITAELCQGVSPYCLPVINNFVTPVPPTTKRRDRGTRVTSNGTVRGRRLRSSTTTDANEVSHLSLSLSLSERLIGWLL